MIIEPPEHNRGAKKERIIRVLLVSDGEGVRDENDLPHNRTEIAGEAGVSASWCSEYLDRLERRELVDGIQVVDVEGLYREWESIRPPRNSVTVSIQHLEQVDLDFVFTTYVAENLHQGHLFASRTDIYIRMDDIADWTDLVQTRGMIGGGDTRIWVSDEGVFFEPKYADDAKTVCLPQLIVDLRDEGGPAIEAADRLESKYHGME